MFCVYQDKLYIADKNLSYSHAAWFTKEGWISKRKDESMDRITRGIIDDKGDIYFYIGDDFRVDKESEDIFFSHLKELAGKLKLDINAQIFGGVIKLKPGEIWPPINKYGKIKDNLK